MKQMERVPLEAAVKYLVRERDALMEKLDMLVPYTKSLEKQLANVKDSRIEELTNENKELRHNFQQMKNEAAALRADYRQSDWFKKLDNDNRKLRSMNSHLRAELCKLAARPPYYMTQADVHTILEITNEYDEQMRGWKDEIRPTREEYEDEILRRFNERKNNKS